MEETKMSKKLTVFPIGTKVLIPGNIAHSHNNNVLRMAISNLGNSKNTYGMAQDSDHYRGVIVGVNYCEERKYLWYAVKFDLGLADIVGSVIIIDVVRQFNNDLASLIGE